MGDKKQHTDTNFVCIIPLESKWNGGSVPRSMRGDKKPNSTMKMHKDKLTTSFGPATSDNHCICMRPRENIICTNCGQTGFARIMLVCPMHPERKYLCDWSRCPNCKGSLFREYR